MPSKKKKVNNKTPNKFATRVEFTILTLFAILVIVLVFISLLQSHNSVLMDFSNIDNESYNLINPIGKMGVYASYGISLFWGHSYSLVLILSLLIIMPICLFTKTIKSPLIKLIAKLNIFALSLQTLVAIGNHKHSIVNGLISYSINTFLKNTFNVIGAIIILAFVNIVALGFLVGFDRFVNILNFTKKNEPKTKKEKKKVKKEKVKVVDESDIDLQLDKVEIPEIVINNHKDYKEETKLTESKIVKDSKNDNFEIVDYVLPDVNEILTSPPKTNKKTKNATEAEIKRISSVLKEKLSEFDIDCDVINVNVGPIITQYELRPAPGVKVNKFTQLVDDLALALKAKSIRIQAPIPGRGLIGIELPNEDRDVIYLKDVIMSESVKSSSFKLGIALGKDISGMPVMGDLAKMPHLLVAGATGSGKSVCVNTIITSLIFKKRPDELRMILIDPKRVELAPYATIPHLIGDVVTDPDNALENMQWAENEMERRYSLLQELRVRDIISYNNKVTKINQSLKEDEKKEHYNLPYIVIIVDEFADLIMTAGRDIELPITRLAQKARAVGIHLILATQRPSRKVITGLIKANFPSRISFQVSSRVESSIILDTTGAEKLLGRGDMLYLPAGTGFPERVHGCFVSDEEVVELCDYLETQPKPVEIVVKKDIGDNEITLDYDDDIFPEAARLVVENNMASVSMLQRHFKIGYARAGRLVDMLESAGIVGPHLGSKSREVIAKQEDLDRYGL